MLRLKTEFRFYPAVKRAVGLATRIVVACLMSVSLWAQQPQVDGFQPITGAPKESIAASPLVYAAYAFVWVVLTVYVFLLWQRIARVEKDLENLRQGHR